MSEMTNPETPTTTSAQATTEIQTAAPISPTRPPADEPAPKKKEPVLILTYGPSGSGKTTDNGYSFPNALFIAAPGALQSIRSTVGFEPNTTKAESISDVTKLINHIGSHREKGGFTHIDSIVIDDFSFLTEQTFSLLEKKHKGGGFALWGELRDQVMDFRNAARFAKVHIIMNAWEQPPKDRKGGGRVKGGPQLSGNLPEQVPAMFDMVLRCGFDTMRKPWSGVYQCSLDPNYIMKDRLHIASRCNPAPMNLAELLRAAGYAVSRRADAPWQEEVVETIARRLLDAGPAQDREQANTMFATLRAKGISEPNVRWTIRDALDRAVIRRAMAVQDNTFF